MEILAVDRAECLFEPAPWPFAEAQADAIDAHWAEAVRHQPRLFDGRVLMQTRGGVERDADGAPVFRGAYAEVRFRAFLAWRDFGHPMPGFRNGFAMAALRGADGAFVLGEMAAHTANAGRVYFPSGTPDRSDIAGTVVDLEASCRRELAEETGLDLSRLAFAPGFVVLADALRVCFMKAVCAPEPAQALAARIETFLGREPHPELARLHVVRTAADISPAMPPFVAAYLRGALSGTLQSG